MARCHATNNVKVASIKHTHAALDTGNGKLAESLLLYAQITCAASAKRVSFKTTLPIVYHVKKSIEGASIEHMYDALDVWMPEEASNKTAVLLHSRVPVTHAAYANKTSS